MVSSSFALIESTSKGNFSWTLPDDACHLHWIARQALCRFRVIQDEVHLPWFAVDVLPGLELPGIDRLPEVASWTEPDLRNQKVAAVFQHVGNPAE